MSISISSYLPNYQSIYNNSLYRSVDRNYDNSYSKEEVSNFAASYEKSTGQTIDVDGLFEAYDVDIDGALSSEEYKNVIADDALGMDVLYGAKQETEASESEKVSGDDLSSLLKSMNNTQKMSLVRSTFKAETTGNLLNAMFGSISLFSTGTNTNSMFNMSNVLTQYNNSKLSSYASRISSLDMLL